MSSSSNYQQHHHDTTTSDQPSDQVAVIAVPFPAQGHLNQLLQLSCLISSYDLPVYYVGFTINNLQAKARINGLNRRDVDKIHFHDIPNPPFDDFPPPDPNATNKFPAHLQPAWDATLELRNPVGNFLRDMADRFKRVVVIHDGLMAFVVQDVASIPATESYAFNPCSAFTQLSFICERQGKPFPEHPKELPSLEGCLTEELMYLGYLQLEPSTLREGDLYNTCRLIEGAYLKELEVEENKKCWAIGPILPTELSPESQHKCLAWLDKHEANSVIYVSFGTTVSLSDEQIKELASGLELSKVKFLWVLRDADKADVFDKQVRSAQLPEGFEERLEGVGIVVRDWAPQPQILAHPSTGGFMSHCGWNSCIESMTSGVPIAAWPMHSDQPRNSAFITDILKTGLIVREWTQRNELVKASTVENVVRGLMTSEEGNEMRMRAEDWGAKLRSAAQPGGASRLEMDSFIAHINRQD